MKIFSTKEEMEKYVEHGNFKFSGNIQIVFDLVCSWNINAWNIDALNINASNIDAENIDAWNIDAGNINAENIDAENIDAWNINALNIDALNIDAWNIDAGNINAENIYAFDIDAGNIDAFDINALNINALNIKYYAFCISYNKFSCISLTGRRKNSLHKSLDSEIIYKSEKSFYKERGARKLKHSLLSSAKQ